MGSDARCQRVLRKARISDARALLPLTVLARDAEDPPPSRRIALAVGALTARTTRTADAPEAPQGRPTSGGPGCISPADRGADEGKPGM
ncbi:hypothetical protein [Dactylosporangium sp. NPDC000521]|uniref:hypothetical protein n=1 Tax=Dactylosporangium sp. NPDC000521 TaxID=3363975 RepID=UPI003679968B